MLSTRCSVSIDNMIQVMTGPVLAELIETMVGALNARDIPTAGSILEHFNRELVQKARHLHCARLFQHMPQALALSTPEPSCIPSVGR